MDAWTFFFGFRGRFNRAKYWLALLIFSVVDLVLMLFGWVFGGTTAFHALSYLINLAIFASSLAVALKRLHDRDRSAWWLVLFYIGPALFIFPALAFMGAAAGSFVDITVLSLFLLKLCLLAAFALVIWGLVEMGFLRGTVGYNNFGADPLAQYPRPLGAAAAQLGR